METLGGLLLGSGLDIQAPGERVFKVTSARGWSGPGSIEQWPGLSHLGVKTESGEYVSEGGAMKYAAVYAAVRILSSIDAALPIHVYRDREGGRGKDKATSDYRYRLLHDQPNEEMTAALFRMYMRQNKTLWGNAYALLKWNRAARLDAIYPLRPDYMQVYRAKSGRKVYAYEAPDAQWNGYYSADEILHFRGLGDDLAGWSPIKLFRQGIGLGLAAEKFGAAFFRNGCRFSGILELAGKVKNLEEVTNKFEEKYAAATNAGRVLAIDSGSKFVTTTIPPEDAQYLETRQWQGSEITAKVYGIPAYMTGDSDKQSNWGTGIEQQSIGFVTWTIMPDLVLQEQEITSKILGDNLYAKYSVDGLLRGDAKSRAEVLQIKRRNGVINADEWRELDEINPIPDGSGQVYIVEANMAPLDMVRQIAEKQAAPAPEPTAEPAQPAQE